MGAVPWRRTPDAIGIQLVLTGNRRYLVRILNIEPVGTCTKPLNGAILVVPSAGDDPVDYIGFNLDEKAPAARTYWEGRWGADFFARTTISLEYGEQHVLRILATTGRYYCQFRLRFTVLDGTRTIQETIGDGQSVFGVSAQSRFRE
jgi:hypothetical protein